MVQTLVRDETLFDPHMIRAWAHANGITVAARGRLPKSVQESYRAAREEQGKPAKRTRKPRTEKFPVTVSHLTPGEVESATVTHMTVSERLEALTGSTADDFMRAQVVPNSPEPEPEPETPTESAKRLPLSNRWVYTDENGEQVEITRDPRYTDVFHLWNGDRLIGQMVLQRL